MSSLKRFLCPFLSVWIVCLFVNFQVRAAEPVDINVNADGFAVNGFDVVSYFEGQDPEKGNNRYSHEFKGARYIFANEKNLQLFKEAPEKYLPAYGGYCAYGVVLGKKFDISSDAWRIVNGVLFFELDKGTRLIWEKDLEKNIAIGDRTWPRIVHVPANDL